MEKDMVLKVQGAGELGGWADMTTICKKVVDVAQYIGTDQGGHEVVLSMPFTSKSGFGSAHNGYPQLHVKIFAKLSEVEHFLEDDDSVSRKTSLVEREDSAISGLTTEGDEVTYSIKAVKFPPKELSTGKISLDADTAALDSWPSDPDEVIDKHPQSPKQGLRLQIADLEAQVEAMQQKKHAVQDAHVAELELQSEQYAELAAKLRKREALASAQEHQVTAAQEDAHETKRKLSRSEQELAAALQQLMAAKGEADTAIVIAAEQPQSPIDTDIKIAMLEERCGALEAQNADGEGRLASLQQDADDALDMAEKATAGLQQEAALLGRERDELKAALASQLAAAAEDARRFEALEQELEEATKNAAQAATEQAARALALYAAEAASLRQQLAEAQAAAPITVAGMLRDQPWLAWGRCSNGTRVWRRLVVAADPGWQRHGHNDAELLIRHFSDDTSPKPRDIHHEVQAWDSEADDQAREVEDIRMELEAVKAQNEELKATMNDPSRLTAAQPLASYEGDGWLEQCCASLAEQLRVAQAENVELQKTVEELRGDSSGQSSPMAWDGTTRTSSGHFESALEMETSSQGSRQSRARTHSWTSQRSLEAQIATLRQQLDISAATEVELQREIELLRMEGGSEAVASAVAVAVAARDSELGAMQRHMADLEDELDRALQEAAEAQDESLEMRNALVHLEAALRDSEAKREAMQQEKHMLEAQLLQTAGDVATAERELTGSQLSSLASARSSGMAYSSDSDESDVSAGGSGGSPHRHISHIRRLAELSAREVESLRAENDAIMKELVEKKMELAELHEELLKMSHAHAHAQQDNPKK
ncbi:hypothetical protein WJX75_006115 [Coccomyxa subellipsoidea]|uniref:C2 NT-type domain-containing protein n=1 Tax=Coccomyxa subellipsoidea TaxID=248742 RepID=A0ABR2YRN7_9CHLO